MLFPSYQLANRGSPAAITIPMKNGNKMAQLSTMTCLYLAVATALENLPSVPKAIPRRYCTCREFVRYQSIAHASAEVDRRGVADADWSGNSTIDHNGMSFICMRKLKAVNAMQIQQLIWTERAQ